MGRICLFIRVSTVEQHLESQETLLRQAALADGHKEADFIVIGNKESAIKLSEEERKGLNELKKLILSENIDCVYIAELSRLSRQPETLYSVRSFLLEHKVQLKCLKPQFTLLTDDKTKYDPNANVIFSLFGALAEQEMIEKKERFARGKKQKAASGKYNGGNIPFGYRINKDLDNLIETDKEQEKVVQLVYDLYEEGYSQPKIAQELPKRGINNVSLSLVHHILMNESYTGIRRKTQNASYERSYPLIITPEQFHRCREIANQNNVTLSKARNIYYAEHLIKCPSCGAFWSASGSKVVYHCPNAWKPLSVWKVDSHKKEKCTNKRSIGINMVDSILWEVAHKREALQILYSNQKTIDEHEENAELIKTKLINIEPRIQKVTEKKERLREMYIEGMPKESYLKKSQQITEEINEIRKEEKQYKEELAHIEETINNLKTNLNILKPTITHYEGGGFVYRNPTVEVRLDLERQIGEITDDAERKKIIKRHIKNVEIIPTTIRFPFNGGIKDTKSRKIIVHCHHLINGDVLKGRENDAAEVYFTIANGGKGLPIILNTHLPEFDDDTPLFYSYIDKQYYPFEDIAPAIYEFRFVDLPKKEKRKKEQQKNIEVIGNRVALTKVPAITGVKYWKLYAMVKNGTLKSEMIAGKYYIDLDELKAMLSLNCNSQH